MTLSTCDLGDSHVQTAASQAAPGPRVVEVGRVVLVQMDSPLDIEQTSAFLARVRALRGSCRRVVVDLRRSDYVDSAGVRGLLGLQAELEADGGELRVIVTKGSRAERTFSLLRLHERLGIYHTAAEAWGHEPQTSGSS